MKKLALLLFSFVTLSCEIEEPKSNQKAITSFVIEGITATIDEKAKTIVATLPLGKDLSKLSPIITISPLAIINPASVIIQDFSKPVVYTLTAEDGSKNTYTVNISRVKSTDKIITGFVVSGVSASFDQNAKTITFSLPTGTNLGNLSPTISISPFAKISPATGIVQDFNKPVVYTLTAEDGSIRTYTVNINIATSLFVKIPDVTFENILIDLKIDDKLDGEVLRTKAESVLNLDIHSKKISSLEGIEAFTNLSVLVCYSTQIKSIDVSINTALLGFNCSSNQLTSIDVSKNTDLQILFCGSNKLQILDISRNTALSFLDCNINHLTSLDISKNIALSYLTCAENKIKNIDFSKNIVLNYLFCASNQLASIDVSKNTDLIYFDCSNNQITRIDVSKNTALTRFGCVENQITSIDVSENTALTNFYCSLNPITSIDVSKNTALKELDCFSLQLTNIDVSNNTVLTLLVCTSNKLKNLDITKNTKLTQLYCELNNLTNLDVSQNISLVYLHCTINQLTSLDVSKNIDLKYLACQKNNITNICVKDLNQPTIYWLKDATATYKVCN